LGIDVTQRGRQNEAPWKASSGTGPAEIGACAATKLTMRAARSRSVPCSPAAVPKSLSAERVQRNNDAQRVADAAPTRLAVLLRARVAAAVIRS
jgi:hypothetical protein